MQSLKIYNTLTRQKDIFEPIAAPNVGMYVCGPTVYNYVHLGNVRTFITFDPLFRYLTQIGYKVRYVRNITDVGHLVGDGDEGEDKIGKMAKLEQLEPMEIVQRYTNDFHDVLAQFNMIPPSIEPTATGHLIEQIEATQSLINKGLAYEANGSIYFDIAQYNLNGNEYGKLSGRVIDELLTETRELEGTSEKRNPLDFAIWKKAAPEHLMQWNSPWGLGFPGWHLECTCMSTKYLGSQFDIHGGGMDLKFPHHECEIAQGTGLNGIAPARYWMHSNMLTVNGQKMSKSLGNSFLPSELFSGSHPLLDQAYSPMTVRFFMLQSQYRSTLDFSNDALKGSQKGFKRLLNGLKAIKEMVYIPAEITLQTHEAGLVVSTPGAKVDEKKISDIEKTITAFYEAMNDDFNTAVAIAQLFGLLKYVNMLYLNQLKTAELGEETFGLLKEKYVLFFEQILGLKQEKTEGDDVLKGMLNLYREYKTVQAYDKIDEIRTYFKAQGLVIRDMKHSIDWAFEE